jgi:HlyD family secretion protein
MLQADLAQTRAAIQEAEALLAEARANADRARELQPTGVLSRQQTTQILTGETTARARLEALRARLHADELRLAQTRILAPDDGIIATRAATEGAVAQPGQELFRLIRQGRLEWRAELTSADLVRVKPGLAAALTTASGQAAQGTVRMVAPTIDAATRTGLVYVDLVPGSDARAGMFARGELVVGRAAGLTLPQSAVLLRDGFHVVLRVGADQRVTMTKVSVGRRIGDRIEITGGLPADAAVVASGGAFLADGDLVRVVDAAPASASAPASTATASTAKPARAGGAAR